MKIIPGGIKDYYDHVAGMYGGGDPLATYHRQRIGVMDSSTGYVKNKTVTMKEWEPLRVLKKIPQYSWSDSRIEDWLIVAGKAYPLVDTGTYPPKFEIVDLTKHAHLVRPVQGRRDNPNADPETEIGVELPHLVELSRAVGHPVFILKSVHFLHQAKEYEFTIDGNCPILSNVGLPSLYPAQQLYQDLAYFVGNTMKISPDLAPPTKMSDQQKVLAAGFDKKISFRHRK